MQYKDHESIAHYLSERDLFLFLRRRERAGFIFESDNTTKNDLRYFLESVMFYRLLSPTNLMAVLSDL